MKTTRHNPCLRTALLALTLLLALNTLPAHAQTYTVIHSFSGASDGSAPISGLSIDRGGRLYGTSMAGGNSGPNCNYNNLGNGCGAVYRLTQHGSAWIVNSLYVFQGGADGTSPGARVIAGPDGTLFGTTQFGGSGPCVNQQFGAGCGTIFRLKPSATACASAQCPWVKTVLYGFDGSGTGTHGANPMSEVVFDASGNFYGTTLTGGMYGLGVVYKMTRSGSGWTYSVIHDFAGQPNDGAAPMSGLVLDPEGNFYGATEGGGSGYGAIYELSPSGNGWTETVLHVLNSNQSDGIQPYGGLVFDAAGNLYGATTAGGSFLGGTVFKLSQSGSGWTFAVLQNIQSYGCDSCLNGPAATLTLDSAGNLYGTLPNGGSSGFCGAAFKLTAQSGYSYSSLHDFTCTSDGSFPYSNLLPDGSGNFYSTAAGAGSSNHGVVFTITP